MLSPEAHTCKNCGNTFTGTFCNLCGEKVILPHDKSIRHFLEHYLHDITHFDTKFFKNVKAIVSKPGLISKDIAEGRSKRWFSVVSFFLVLNLIYFLLPMSDTFNTRFYSQMNLLPYSVLIVQPLVEKKIANEGISLNEFEDQFDHKSSKTAKLLIIIIVLGFGLLFYGIHFKSDLFFTDHLTLAFETICFILILLNFILPILVLILSSLPNVHVDAQTQDYIFSTVLSLPIIVFLIRAFKRFYSQRWAISVLKATLSMAGFFCILTMYRLLLFFVVYWQV